MKRGKLIIFSGPSGVGKSTVRKELFKDLSLNLKYSISMTTRPIRQGEQNDVDYHFVSEKEFLQAIKENRFLEYAQFVNNYYGTLKDDVNKMLDEGFNVMLEIEVEGAKQIIKKVPEAISIFLVPPSLEVLKKRIIERKSESEEVINLRLAKASEEIKLTHLYKYVVVNDLLSKTVDEVKEIIKKEQMK